MLSPAAAPGTSIVQPLPWPIGFAEMRLEPSRATLPPTLHLGKWWAAQNHSITRVRPCNFLLKFIHDFCVPVHLWPLCTSFFASRSFEVNCFHPPFLDYLLPNVFVDIYPTSPQHSCQSWKHTWLSAGFLCSPDHPVGPSLHLSQLASQPLTSFHLGVFTGSRIISSEQSSLVCWVWGFFWQRCLKCSIQLGKMLVFFCDVSWAACLEGSSQSHALPAGKEGSWQAPGRERSWQQEWGRWRKAAVGYKGGGGGSAVSPQQPAWQMPGSLTRTEGRHENLLSPQLACQRKRNRRRNLFWFLQNRDSLGAAHAEEDSIFTWSNFPQNFFSPSPTKTHCTNALLAPLTFHSSQFPHLPFIF